jgi:hypothetical protein
VRKPALTQDKLHRRALYLSDRTDYSTHFNKLSVMFSDVTDKVNRITDSISVIHELEVPTVSIQLHKSCGRGAAFDGHLSNANLDNSTLRYLRIVVDHFLKTTLDFRAVDASFTILSLIKCDDTGSDIRLTPQQGAFLQSLTSPWQQLEFLLFSLLLDICLYQAFFGNVVGEGKKDILSRKFRFDKNNYPDDLAIIEGFVAENAEPGSYSFAMSCHQNGRLDETKYVNKWFDFKVHLKGVSVIDSSASGFESYEALTGYLLNSLKNRAGQVNPKTLQQKVVNSPPGKLTLVFLERLPSNKKERETVNNYLSLRKPSSVSIVSRKHEQQFRHYIDRYCRFVRFNKESNQ